MSKFTQTIEIEFWVCHCRAKLRQVFDMDRDTGEILDGDPQTTVLRWNHRCQAHASLNDNQAHDRIVWEMRAINRIEAELIAAAPAEELVDEECDDGSTIKKLKHEIEVEIGTGMKVKIPKELKHLEGGLTPQENIEFIWQR